MKRIIRLTEGELRSIINQAFLEKIKGMVDSIGINDTAQMMGVSEYEILKIIGDIPEDMTIYNTSIYIIPELNGTRVPTNIVNEVNSEIFKRRTNIKAEYLVTYSDSDESYLLLWEISFTDVNGDNFIFGFYATPYLYEPDSIPIELEYVTVNGETYYITGMGRNFPIRHYKIPKIKTLDEFEDFLFNDYLTICREIMDGMIMEYIEIGDYESNG
jgi:hypothetical protein